MKEEQIKKAVRENYAGIVSRDTCACGESSSTCCGGARPAEGISRQIGYTEEDLKSVPEGANLGLGCGNPIALASLKPGETVLDLGSGAGFDCFLAAKRVGRKGKVIGVDMTPEMLDRARANVRKNRSANVEFRLGEIENLPVADSSVDIIISNCVINLSPDKPRVFAEAYRVLKPGGRLMVSDIVLEKPLPAAIKKSIAAYVHCVAGAAMQQDYLDAIAGAGFKDVSIVERSYFPVDCLASDPTVKAIVMKIPQKALEGLVRSVASIRVQAVKP